jgi:uncharacterized phage protein (TIGR02216 family)
LHFGLGRLRLSPAAFWALTPKELAALSGALQPLDGIDRAALSALMRRWPDTKDR